MFHVIVCFYLTFICMAIKLQWHILKYYVRFFRVWARTRTHNKESIRFICYFYCTTKYSSTLVSDHFKCECARCACSHGKVSDHKTLIKMLEIYLQNAQSLLFVMINYIRNGNTHPDPHPSTHSVTFSKSVCCTIQVLKCWSRGECEKVVKWNGQASEHKWFSSVCLATLMILRCDPAKAGHLQHQQQPHYHLWNDIWLKRSQYINYLYFSVSIRFVYCVLYVYECVLWFAPLCFVLLFGLFRFDQGASSKIRT